MPHLNHNPAIWADHWAGVDGAYLRRSLGDGERIVSVEDCNGSNRPLLAGSSPAGYRDSVVIQGWDSRFPPIGVHKIPGKEWYGSTYYLRTPFAPVTDWYIAVVFANTRDGGTRDLLGYGPSNSLLTIDQARDQVHLQPRIVAEIPKGLVFMELYCKGGKLRTHVNRHRESKVDCASVQFDGIGYKGSGTSQWDDYLFQVTWIQNMFYPGADDAVVDIRENVRLRWGL